MKVPQLVIVGADKGGVGKTMISRTLMDYYKHHSVEHRAFDTEAPLGVLRRFYPDRAEVVDLIASDTPDCLSICLPTRFVLSEVKKRYGDRLLRWVRMVDPGKTRVDLLLREQGR